MFEKAKYHLLQCATGESVLRLDKTELSMEAMKIQDIYMKKQKHENLHEYLHHAISDTYQPLYIQVSITYIKLTLPAIYKPHHMNGCCLGSES